jgi:glyoxylase-like metal-dependent hydrolase (beta-lactamase superfamily II)
MTATRFFGRLCALAGACLMVSAASAGVERMYVLDCGFSRTGDVSANWTPGVHQGEPREFSDHCYLIRHGEHWLLWDTGMADAIAAKPEGVSAAGGLLTLWVRKPLRLQLEVLGLQPTDITHLALSHFHGDHVGNANLFTAATLYVQGAEAAAAFGPDAAKFGFNPALYKGLEANTRIELDGDHDVFGDDSVRIVATPGHTPGHQSLLVRLPKTGAVVLSGDMVHLEENWHSQRVPSRNFDRDLSLRSMQRVADLLRSEGATLWINHELAHSAAVPKSPQSIE